MRQIMPRLQAAPLPGAEYDVANCARGPHEADREQVGLQRLRNGILAEEAARRHNLSNLGLLCFNHHRYANKRREGLP